MQTKLEPIISLDRKIRSGQPKSDPAFVMSLTAAYFFFLITSTAASALLLTYTLTIIARANISYISVFEKVCLMLINKSMKDFFNFLVEISLSAMIITDLNYQIKK